MAEGFTGAGSGRSAIRLARSFVARFIELCVGEPVLDEVPERVVATRDDEAGVFWALLDLPDLEHKLAARLTIADLLLAKWMVGDLPVETGIEEMQTAVEIVLRRVLRAGQGVHFPRLTDRAVEHGLINEGDRRVLTELNDQRVEIKHRGGVIPPGAEDDTRSALHSAAEVLDRLLASHVVGEQTSTIGGE